MAFLKRVFSSDYRRALAAEAAGDYLEAARAYALAGERDKVGEMHLLRADKAPDREARLRALRDAIRWCGEEAEGHDVLRTVGRRLFELAREAGIITEADRAVVREAAVLFRRTGEPLWAAEAFELLGDAQAAAEAYQAAGEVEQLERLLAREDERRARAKQLREATAAYERLLASGRRTQALAALSECARLDPSGPSSRLCEELAGRRITSGVVTLRLNGGAPVVYAGEGAFPVTLGREGSTFALRDPRVSRHHAEIVLSGSGLCLRDAGSRHGTRVGGLAIDGLLPLEGDGEFTLGEAVRLRHARLPEGVRLEVAAGADRGLCCLVLTAAHRLPGTPLVLAFAAGLPTVALERAEGAASPPLRLGDVEVDGAIELLHGDRLALGAAGAVEVE